MSVILRLQGSEEIFNGHGDIGRAYESVTNGTVHIV
jgi:hypothetical protein